MQVVKGLAGIFAGVFLAATSATAVPIAYDETVSGDLDGTQSFALDAGANTFTGSIARDAGNTDSDEFQVTLGSGLAIASVTIEFLRFELTAGTAFEVTPGLDMSQNTPGFVFLGVTPFFDILGAALPETLAIAFANPFTPGFPVDAEVFSGASISFGGAAFEIDYVATFNIREASRLPEPSTVALIGLGLMVLGFTRRRDSLVRRRTTSF